jgi:Family of unknown function (DUF6152)
MKTRLFSIVAATAGLLFLSSSLLAHHGQANYDTKNEVTVTGTVTDFQFVNPHSLIFLEAKDDKGQMQKWQGELTSPNHLVRAGWNKTSLKPGDQITVSGFPARSGANSLWIRKLVVNGEEMRLGAGN